MRNIIIILIIAAVVFFGYQYFLHKPSGPGAMVEEDDPMVPYGTPPEKNEGVQRIDPEGSFDADQYVVEGRPTIIDFCADNCPGCRLLHDDHYPRFLKIRPDVATFYIRLPSNWHGNGVWERYGVKVSFTPHVMIYGPDGKLIAEDREGGNAGHTFLYKWMNDEIRKDDERRRRQRAK